MSFTPPFSIPLPSSTTSASVTGTTSKTPIYSFVIKAGSMNLNSRLIITWSYTITNNANTKLMEMEFGSTNLYSVSETTVGTRSGIKNLQNRNSLSSQVGSILNGSTYGQATGAVVTMTENTANDITFTMYVTLANSADTVTLNYLIPMLISGTS